MNVPFYYLDEKKMFILQPNFMTFLQERLIFKDQGS